MTCSPIPGTTSASMLLPPELSASLCKGTTMALSLPFQRNGHQLLSIFPAGHPGGEVTGAQATRTCSLLLCSALPVPEPSQSCHFYFLSCGWTPSSSVPITSFQNSCPWETQEKQDLENDFCTRGFKSLSLLQPFTNNDLFLLLHKH